MQAATPFPPAPGPSRPSPARPAARPPLALHSPSSPACSRSGAETTSRRARRPRAPATMAPPGASLARSASPRRAQRLRCPCRAASSAAERAAGTGRSRRPAPNPIGAAGSPARRGRRPPRPAPRAGPQRRKSRSPAAAGPEAGGAPDAARGPLWVPGAPCFSLSFSSAAPPPMHVNLGARRTPGLETCRELRCAQVLPRVPERAVGGWEKLLSTRALPTPRGRACQ